MRETAAAARRPDHVAIADDRTDRRLTYRQLLEEIDAYAAGFAAQGLGPGQIVATVLPNLFEHAVVLLALHRLGAVPAMINARLKPEEAAGLVRQGVMAGAVTLAGRSDAWERWLSTGLIAITPETEKTSHYFWAQAQNFGTDDPSISDLDFRMTHGAFLEDLKMIGGQQANIDLDTSAPRVNIATDTGGVQARRIVESLIAAEKSGAPKRLEPVPLHP